MAFYHTNDIGAWLGAYNGPSYKVILADPPWDYADKKPVGSHGGCPYPTMPDAAIYSLPVQRLAARDCALLLWTTMPKLAEGLATIQAWGFRYVTCAFTWVKTDADGSIYSGMGHWTNGNAELCLLGRRGRPRRIAKDVKQIVRAPRGVHSTKPADVRWRIDRLFGEVPRIELFARQNADGWDGVGNGLYAAPAPSFYLPMFDQQREIA